MKCSPSPTVTNVLFIKSYPVCAAVYMRGRAGRPVPRNTPLSGLRTYLLLKVTVSDETHKVKYPPISYLVYS